jgi:hypothetical protein
MFIPCFVKIGNLLRAEVVDTQTHSMVNYDFYVTSGLTYLPP